MNLRPDKTSFTDEEHAELRAYITQATAGGLSQADIARQSEVSPTVLSQYLGGKYGGDNDAIAAKLHKWAEALKKSIELRSRLPVAPVYLPLLGSDEILKRLHYAREGGRIVAICSEPGLSKTSTAREYQRVTPRVWLATMDPSTRGVNTCLVEILAAMGEPDAKGTPQALARRVLNKAVEAPGLIIIDEAQHLSDQAVEQLRAINDRARARGARVGIAMMGNLLAFTRTVHDGSRPAFAQVSSRMAMRMWIATPDARDVETMATAWGQANGEIVGPAEVKFCQEIARKPGGLRNVEMAMESALMAAWGSEQPLSVDHLRWAFGQLSGQARAA